MRKILLWLLLALPAPALAQITPGGGLTIGAPIFGSCTTNYNLYNNGGVLGCQANGGGGIIIGTTTITGGTTGRPLYDNAGVAGEYSTLPVAFGGTNCTAATIACFNNITGFTAAGTTGTTSTNLVFSTSPTLVTPVLGVASATSLAIGGATIGSNALAVTGTWLNDGSSNINFANANLSFRPSSAGQTLAVFANGSDLATFRYDRGIQINSGLGLTWGGSTSGGSTDLWLSRDAAGVLSLRGATSTTAAAMSFYTYGASPPAAPGASIARLYSDTSGGKIRLMVLFPSGAAQQLAIEP